MSDDLCRNTRHHSDIYRGMVVSVGGHIVVYREEIMKSAIPKWLLEQEKLTAREWKQRKRREIQAVIRAMEYVHRGCAYTPNIEGVHIGEILMQLRKLARAWSQKEWGK